MVGIDNDYYLNLTTYDIYQKILGIWTKIGNIKGASGTSTKVGFFICPLTIGNFSITGLGFKPKVIELWCSKNDGFQTWFHISHGLVDALGNQNVAFALGNYSNTFRGVTYTDRCIYVTSGAGAIQVYAIYVSMNDDGFTLNFLNTNSIFIVRYMAIG